LDFARAVEAAILAKLASAELPEPEITLAWDSWDESWEATSLQACSLKTEENRIIGYTADQLRQAFAQGAASQLSAEPEAWTWNTKSQHDGFLDAHFQFSKPIDDPRIVDLCPLFTLKEPK
jgi:hypothetical protein